MTVRYYTTRDASELAGFTQGYLRRKLEQGGYYGLKKGLDYFKYGNIWCIRADKWDMVIERRKKNDNTRLR